MKVSEKNKDFFANVYDVVRLIPKGRVTSYGLIAKYLGSPRSSRMVGWAMNNAHSQEDIPAHRVVNRNGLLTGKMNFESPTLMEEKLLAEGIQINDDQVLNFKDVLWDPSLALLL